MRVVLDTNILVSALIAPSSKPAAIVDVWLDGNLRS
jgi:predicted nucleic acid-binding protein